MTTGGAAPLVVATATRLETRAARAALEGRAQVIRVGVGGRFLALAGDLHPARAGADGPRSPAGGIVSTGICGALDTGLLPGDAIIPDEVGTEDGVRTRCAPWLVDALRAAAAERGVRVHRGPLLTVPRLVTGGDRAGLACAGWIGVDMESAMLAGIGAPFAAVRVVLDSPADELDPAWSRPVTALLRPRLWGQARRLAVQAPRRARCAAEIVAGALDRLDRLERPEAAVAPSARSVGVQ